MKYLKSIKNSFSLLSVPYFGRALFVFFVHLVAVPLPIHGSSAPPIFSFPQFLQFLPSVAFRPPTDHYNYFSVASLRTLTATPCYNYLVFRLNRSSSRQQWVCRSASSLDRRNNKTPLLSPRRCDIFYSPRHSHPPCPPSSPAVSGRPATEHRQSRQQLRNAPAWAVVLRQLRKTNCTD